MRRPAHSIQIAKIQHLIELQILWGGMRYGKVGLQWHVVAKTA